MCQPGPAPTGLCYANPTLWTYVGENNYMQQNMRGQDSNLRPPDSDTMLKYLPLSVGLYNPDDIERVREAFIRFQPPPPQRNAAVWIVPVLCVLL
jgi:hypothetical protein